MSASDLHDIPISALQVFALPRMQRAPDQWAKMVAEKVAEGSQAQVVYALKDAQRDIASLVASLSDAVMRLSRSNPTAT